LDWDEIYHDCSSSKCASFDGVGYYTIISRYAAYSKLPARKLSTLVDRQDTVMGGQQIADPELLSASS